MARAIGHWLREVAARAMGRGVRVDKKGHITTLGVHRILIQVCGIIRPSVH